MHLLQRKTKGNIIREVYRYEQTLIKRFIKTSPLPDMRRVWRMEDQALKRLEGLSVPATYGYKIHRHKDFLEIIYAREFVQGQPIDTFTLEDMVPLGQRMAQIHKRGVITRDPAPNNFIKTQAGDILFIDFGRSALLNPKNPGIFYYLGKELARLRYHALSGDKVLYTRFQEVYFSALTDSSVQPWLIRRICAPWYRRFTHKHSRPQK
ncbi:MAG: hypothetical protein U5L00_09500 [Desulfovermiculus sp.]|nr:hypothetical protein [Desulfovermiculus sp.]